MCGFVHVRVGAYRGQRCRIPLKLEWQVVVSFPVWVLEIQQHLYPELLSHLSSPISVIIKKQKARKSCNSRLKMYKFRHIWNVTCFIKCAKAHIFLKISFYINYSLWRLHFCRCTCMSEHMQIAHVLVHSLRCLSCSFHCVGPGKELGLSEFKASTLTREQSCWPWCIAFTH